MNGIQTEGVTVTIERRTVLRDITMGFGAGRFIGLIGPNGSGKSTLLRTMAGFVRPSAGRVLVAGKPVAEYGRKELARMVGYVPQDTAADFHFPAKEIVLMGRYAHMSRFREASRADMEAAARAMQLTATLHLADRPVTGLSGGQRQMVFIAKALAQSPRLLLLDEPISALDIRYQLHVLRLVRSLTQQGLTAVAALHDLNLAARYCDQLVLLADGQTLEIDTPWNVLTPELIRRAYGVHAEVRADPVLGFPVVTAVDSVEPEDPEDPEDPDKDYDDPHNETIGGFSHVKKPQVALHIPRDRPL
ncbi:ABC transporter ATP-binding protein [Paenibacillus hodogayensis]|uniref:ABC transporter ATP-binding protein n=1 Tax=Paenibacillus hodogayensis TaxID=279208 RepID=A0ABV5VR45_9BACL